MAGLGQAAPLWSLVFTVPFIVGYVGKAAPLAMLAAMLAVGATANSLAQFSAIYPSAGSFSTFIARGIGPRMSVVVSISALLGYMVAFAGIYVFVGIYVATEVFHTTSTVAILAITLIYGAAVLVPTIMSIRIGVRIVVIAFAIEVATLLILAIAVLVQGGESGLTFDTFTTFGGHAKDFGLAFALAILTFVGFEAPAPLAEETDNPRRNVPLAVMLTVGILGVLLVLSTYSLVIGVGTEHAGKLATSVNPLKDVAHTYVSFLVPLVVWIALTSVTGSYIAANLETARVIFNGARERLWFSSLAKTHPRYHSPYLAGIAFVAPSVLLGFIVAVIVDPSFAAGFLGTYGSLGIITMYFVTNLALVSYWARNRDRAGESTPRGIWLHLVTPLVGAVLMLLPVWSILQPGQPWPFNYLWLWFLMLLAVGTLYMLWLNATRPDKLANAGSIILGEVQPEEEGVRT